MILMRSCQGHDELEACVQLQIETWGYDPTDVIPRKAFLVWQKVGGQVIGAFDTGLPGADPEGAPESLVGFVLSLPGIKIIDGEPKPYLHSHMLAVRDNYRNRGVGMNLKFAQREDALKRGIHLIEWTFDPLEIKNAYLNIRKLGAIVRRYEVDFYGASSSRLQGGLPTDRLVAEWQLDSPRVEAAQSNHLAAAQQITERIPVPAAIYQWKASDSNRQRALTVQLENRERFQDAFARGLAVIGYTVDAEGNGVFELGPLTQAETGLKSQGVQETL
jgi:predicted GNAT superfamily acetyltransferase